MGNDIEELPRRQTSLAWVAGNAPDELAIPMVDWLDIRSAAQVRAIVAAVARAYPEFVAAILFGSVARHDERSVDDEYPSDVDLMLLLDPTRLAPESTRYPLQREIELHGAIADAQYSLPDAPREVKVLLVERDLARWDEALVANVARDGLLLWARQPEGLPDRWRHLATRHQRAVQPDDPATTTPDMPEPRQEKR